MPVLIYERIQTAKFLMIKRTKAKLVFMGKLPVLGILLIGLTGYMYLAGTKYQPPILNGLLAIMATAKLDDRTYRITDWSQKKGRLLVYVERQNPKMKAETENRL
ncbi:MAG TPA: hypothetical protein VLV31_07060 [Candidatus Acidoferrales bacterium]|nr:hypothetical protein [Candidatus Acidoferrales bacterium]